MATFYILHSKQLNRYYIGSCKDLHIRFEQHLNAYFEKSFTSLTKDWEVYFTIENIDQNLARNLESHIKKMKSKVYIQNIKKYPEIMDKLIIKYSSAGSSR